MMFEWNKVRKHKVLVSGIKIVHSVINFTAPSQADIRLGLTLNEKKKGLKSGAITWLVMGISLEDEQ
jgi:hypothetical protein